MSERDKEPRAVWRSARLENCGTYLAARRACFGRLLAGALLLALLACGQSAPPDARVQISPSVLRLAPGERYSFRATLSEAAPLTWEASGGLLEVGEYTAVFTAPPTEGVYALTVKSATSRATATITVARSELPGGRSSLSGTLATANRLIPLAPSDRGGLSALAALERLPDQVGATQAGPAYAPGEVLVQYRADALAGAAGAEAARRLARELEADYGPDYGLSLLRPGGPAGADLFALGPGRTLGEVVERLLSDPRVRTAEPNYFLRTASLPGDPYPLPGDPYLREQWALAAAGLPVAWGVATGAGRSGDAPVVVAVIDSGFDLRHEDLVGRFLPGYDFCARFVPFDPTKASQPSGCVATDDDPSHGSPDNIHGTHVAGIIGAAGDNGRGVAGVAYGGTIRLLPVKIFDDNGRGATTLALADAIRWAVGLTVTTRDGKTVTNPHPARVINLSLGSYDASSAVQAAIHEARARGAVIVAATGNDGRSEIMFPAAADGVIAVGAANQSFRLACFSNYGSSPRAPGKVDLIAPGGEGGCDSSARSQTVLSTLPGHRYGGLAGTSMAAPVVAGVAALVLSHHPGLRVAELERRLLDSAYFDPKYMTAERYGAGIVRAERALGLPGPGDLVSVSAQRDGRTVASGKGVLDLRGGSSTFTLNGLPEGSYTLLAGEDGGGRLFGRLDGLVLDEGEARGGLVVELAARP